MDFSSISLESLNSAGFDAWLLNARQAHKTLSETLMPWCVSESAFVFSKIVHSIYFVVSDLHGRIWKTYPIKQKHFCKQNISIFALRKGDTHFTKQIMVEFDFLRFWILRLWITGICIYVTTKHLDSIMDFYLSPSWENATIPAFEEFKLVHSQHGFMERWKNFGPKC